MFLAFFGLLGDVFEHLNYWGSKEGECRRKGTHKLTPTVSDGSKMQTQLEDLAFRFGLSCSQSSQCITIWINFL